MSRQNKTNEQVLPASAASDQLILFDDDPLGVGTRRSQREVKSIELRGQNTTSKIKKERNEALRRVRARRVSIEVNGTPMCRGRLAYKSCLLASWTRHLDHDLVVILAKHYGCQLTAKLFVFGSGWCARANWIIIYTIDEDDISSAKWGCACLFQQSKVNKKREESAVNHGQDKIK